MKRNEFIEEYQCNNDVDQNGNVFFNRKKLESDLDGVIADELKKHLIEYTKTIDTNYNENSPYYNSKIDNYLNKIESSLPRPTDEDIERAAINYHLIEQFKSSHIADIISFKHGAIAMRDNKINISKP